MYLLIALIEKSLVVADEDGDRYRMLETVREYAQEKLAANGLARLVRIRHRNYFLKLAEQADSKLAGANQAVWLLRLDVELDNLRSALECSLPGPRNAEALKLCHALQPFWISRGHFSEGRGWCALALNNAEAEGLELERARVLNTSGTLAHYLSDDVPARALHQESLAIMRKLGDMLGIAVSLHSLGNLGLSKCEYASAQALYEESLGIRRQLGDQVGIAYLLHNLGLLAYHHRNYLSADALYKESLAIKRELGDRGGISFSLHNLAMVANAQGDFARSQALYTESLAIKRELGDRPGIASALNNLGMVAVELGEFASAKMLFEQSLATKRELGEKRGAANTLNNLGSLALDLGELAAARAYNRESLAIRREIEDPWGIANSMEGLGAVAAAAGDSLRAARIWGAAARLRAEKGSQLPPNEQLHFDRHVNAARSSLGDDDAFDSAWHEGGAMSLEQAIDLALEHTTD